MKKYIEKRVYEICEYIINTGATVREAAKEYNISKSSVHKDATERISELNPIISKKVKKVLSHNLSERHIRGGEATKQKYQKSGKQMFEFRLNNTD